MAKQHTQSHHWPFSGVNKAIRFTAKAKARHSKTKALSGKAKASGGKAKAMGSTSRQGQGQKFWP